MLAYHVSDKEGREKKSGSKKPTQHQRGKKNERTNQPSKQPTNQPYTKLNHPYFDVVVGLVWSNDSWGLW
jgi:hypothetical protein